MTKEVRDRILQKSFLIRAVEQKLLVLFQEGKINGTVHTCIGQELTGVCAAEHLREDDYVISNHRGHGHFLSRNEDLTSFFAEIMGRETGVCGGFGGSQHFYTKNHLSNGIQGGMTPIGTGLALANKIKKNDKLVLCFIGDGTLGEGIIYEAFNIASLWELPIVFVLENNKIAQSTHFEQTFSGSIQQRVEGFGLTYFKSNTWDIDDLFTTFESATTLSRKQKKATFIEIDTYRLSSHSKGDDNRNPKEVASYKEKDILNKAYSEHAQKTNDLLKTITQKIEKAVNEALDAPVTALKKSIKKKKNKAVIYSAQPQLNDTKRINELIHEALKEQFEAQSCTIMIGEDIEYKTPWSQLPYGGAFKVSNTLSEHFKNIKNTPISEAAITGIGTGLSIGGMTPIVEIMFGDFMTLTFDQIYNHACKFYGMYNGQISVPLVIRTPMGGKRGYGPTHSQSLEKHFLGIKDLVIIALNNRIDPKQLYKAAFTEKSPTLMIENKVLYTKKLQTQVLLGYDLSVSDEKYPTVKISPLNRKADITILCYGEVLEDVEKAVEIAFDEEEIFCEIICPSQINPINIAPVLQSVLLSESLLTIEEGSSTAAYSSEIAALLLERQAPLKSFKRLANNEIIPSSSQAELTLLPNIDSIFKKIKDTYNDK